LPVNTQPARDSVRLYSNPKNTKANVDVLVGGQQLRMLLDTGAVICLIPKDIATRLVKDGAARDGGTAYVTLANGTSSTMPIIVIHEIRIGWHVVRDVKASVAAVDNDKGLLSPRPYQYRPVHCRYARGRADLPLIKE
jgi:predicted aspartyl protease